MRGMASIKTAHPAPGNEYTSRARLGPNESLENRETLLRPGKAAPIGIGLFRVFRRHQADIGQIAIALGEVHAVTDNKQVGDGESDVISFDLLHAP